MYRAALRTAPSALRAARPMLAASCRRLASTSTAPAKKKGSWKGTGLRWGLAAAAVYFYNTSPLFADEMPPQVGPPPPHFSDEDLPTIDALIEEKRRQAALAAPPPPPAPTPKAQPTEPEKATAQERPAEKPTEDKTIAAEATESSHEPGSPEALEHEAKEQGAFDPETGEINWDCPCLGGMAHGPCGEEFKAAFSCFVYSKEEPKGMDCIDKFQDMQTCFRKYPEVYGSELADDDDEEGTPAEGSEAQAKKEDDKPAADNAASANKEVARPKETAEKSDTDKSEKQ